MKPAPAANGAAMLDESLPRYDLSQTYRFNYDQYLDAGAEAVQLATSAMLDPLVGFQIRSQW